MEGGEQLTKSGRSSAVGTLVIWRRIGLSAKIVGLLLTYCGCPNRLAAAMLETILGAGIF